MNKLTCKRCGHTWIARTEKPLQCPFCKSLAWDKDKKDKEGK